MSSLDAFARTKLDQLESKALRRRLAVTERGTEGIAVRSGPDGARTLVSFCCSDYLHLSQNQDVKRAAAAATRRYGAGAGGSRLITGNHPLYDRLEHRLANLKGTEAAIVFGSGYLANIGVIPALIGLNDLILIDELAHNCLFAGARMARAKTLTFRHNDADHAYKSLKEHRDNAAHAIILTDGLFSMDGDLATISDLVAIARECDTWLLIDDAHGIGLLNNGRGSSYVGDGSLPADLSLQTGALSKAFGSYGGFLCASQTVISLIKTRARTLIYSTALPPSAIAASLAAIDIFEKDPALCAQPVENAKLFARIAGLPEPQSPIVPLVLGDPETTLAVSQELEREGFLVSAIRPPTVPEGTARLRFTFAAGHQREDIRRLAQFVRDRVMPRRVA